MPVTERSKFTSDDKSSGPLATLPHGANLIVAWAGTGELGNDDKGNINVAQITPADLPKLNAAKLPNQQLLKNAAGKVEKAYNTLTLVDFNGAVWIFWDGGGSHINGAELTGLL